MLFRTYCYSSIISKYAEKTIIASYGIINVTTIEGVFQSGLVRMDLEYEWLVVTFPNTITCRIFLKGAPSENIVMLTLYNMQSGALISN